MLRKSPSWSLFDHKMPKAFTYCICIDRNHQQFRVHEIPQLKDNRGRTFLNISGLQHGYSRPTSRHVQVAQWLQRLCALSCVPLIHGGNFKMLVGFSGAANSLKKQGIHNFITHKCCLRAASPKYQLDLEIAKKSNFFKLAQNEALRALVTKISF